MSTPGVADGRPDETLDDLVRRVDPDRWLASRFIADPQRRAVVVAVYALNHELARIGETVTNPLVGEIRLAWWRERIEELASGKGAPSHPVLLALAPDIVSARLPADLLDALVEARHADLGAAPFADDAALALYLDGTAGAVMALAARALSPEAPLRAVVEAGRAWGLAGLYRAREHWRTRDRRWIPASWGVMSDAELGERVRAEMTTALAAARREVRALEVAAFPTVAYAGLARAYARGRAPGELEKRVRLLGSTVSGRI